MGLAMRKYAILAALLGSIALSACQFFTAGETVSEPDPAAAAPAAPAAKAPAPPPDPAAAQNAKEAAPAEQPESATAAHILIRYAGALRTTAEITRTKEDARKLAQEVWQKASAAGANFAALADQYTEDPSGKGRGGKLGTFPRGRMVPEFDKPLFALRPGQVSEVIETPFGFHIIYRES
jgi:parvulin-like peptidyl-prolyl isomerase